MQGKKAFTIQYLDVESLVVEDIVTSYFCFSFWLMPAFMLKKIVLGNFASGPLDPEMADGIDFMVDRVGRTVCSDGCGLTL